MPENLISKTKTEQVSFSQKEKRCCCRVFAIGPSADSFVSSQMFETCTSAKLDNACSLHGKSYLLKKESNLCRVKSKLVNKISKPDKFQGEMTTSDETEEITLFDGTKEVSSAARTEEMTSSDRIKETLSSDGTKEMTSSDTTKEMTSSAGMTPTERSIDMTAYDRTIELTTSDGTKGMTPTDRIIDMSASHRTEVLTTSDGTKEWTASDATKDLAAFARTKEMTESDRTKEMTTSDGTKDCTASERTKEMTASDGIKDLAASERTNEMTASDRTKEMTASDGTKDCTASERTKEMTASHRTKEMNSSDADDTKDCTVFDKTKEMTSSDADKTKDCTVSEITKEMTSDRTKGMTASDGTHDCTASERTKEMTESDRTKEMALSDGTKDTTAPDRKKEMTASDRTKEMTAADGTKDWCAFDRRKVMTAPDRTKVTTSSDVNKDWTAFDRTKDIPASGGIGDQISATITSLKSVSLDLECDELVKALESRDHVSFSNESREPADEANNQLYTDVVALSCQNIIDMRGEIENEIFVIQPKVLFSARNLKRLLSHKDFCLEPTDNRLTYSVDEKPKRYLYHQKLQCRICDKRIDCIAHDNLNCNTNSRVDRCSVLWNVFELSLGAVHSRTINNDPLTNCHEKELKRLPNGYDTASDHSRLCDANVKSQLAVLQSHSVPHDCSYHSFHKASIETIIVRLQSLSFATEISEPGDKRHETLFKNNSSEFMDVDYNRNESIACQKNTKKFDVSDNVRQKERKTYLDQDIDDDEIEGKRTYLVEEKLASTKHNKSFVVTDLRGEDFNLKYLQENGLQYPILFKEKTGLGLRVPSENFQVSDVKACVGSRRILDVMDVTTQKAMEMTMKEWVKYYESSEKDKLLNVISLEFSHTKLENYVESPSLVREVDWVDIAWPQHLKDCQTESTNAIDKMKYPKVQKYCLMSVKGCYTDFHIDFGGTSVWYHILHGEKVFWLIPPTVKNVSVYENWVLSGKQGDVFLADVLNDCQKVTLYAGSTFIIPSGWIHAVYTPKDSLVFGGNFLHSFNIDKQLMVSGIEEKTHVPVKFRYPFYAEIGWYVLERYVHCLTGQTYLEKPKLSDDLELQMSGMSTSPESPLTDDAKMDIIKVEQDIITPKLPKRVAVTLTRIDNAYSQSPRRQSSSDEDSMASGPPRSPLETPNGHTLYRKSSTESSNSVQDNNIDTKLSKTPVESKLNIQIDKQKGKEKSSARRKFKTVHLTKYEKIGLTKLVQWIEDLPATKKGIPKDLLNPETVLQEIKLILEEHMNDDEKLAATGEPVLVWTKATKKLIKMKQKAKLMGATHVPKGTGKSSKAAGERHRRVRCKKCEPCTRADCRECNFCKDMKKYGGPGRMKQSCISRQCLAPCLAHSAICLICKEDSHIKDASGDMISSLMECGVCWEIVHPNCLKKKHENLEGDGVVNEDLPNSWICPKCSSDGKDKLKPRVFKGGWRPSPAATPSPVASPNPEHPPGEEVVTEGKRVVSKHPLDQPKPYIPRVYPTGNLPSPGSQPGSNPLSWQPADDKLGTADVKSEAIFKEEENSEIDMEVEEDKQVEKLSASQGSVKKSVKRKSPANPDQPDSGQKKPRLSLSVSPRGKSKSPKPQKPVTSRSTGKKKKSPLSDSGTISPESLKGGRPKREENISSPFQHPSTSYDFDDSEFTDKQTLTLPSLEKGKGAIARGGRRQKSGKLFRTHIPESESASGVGGVTLGTAGSSLKLDITGSPIKQFSMRKKPEDIGKALLEHIEKRGLKVAPQKYVVRPTPGSPPKNYMELTTGDKHLLPYNIWTKIFSYLSSADLARCLCVCRVWNRWCINPELWKEIDLSRNRIVQNHLMGIVRRQPEALILSSVIMTPKQLTWLVERIPLLKKLVLSKCSWATMSGLCTSACPLLTELDISWASGITDQFFEDLITPPVDRKPGVKSISRLHRLKILHLAGTEITDHSMNHLSVHLSRLEVLDLSYCTRLMDKSISILSSSKSAMQETLRVLNMAGCRQLSDASLQLIKNFKHLNFLNLSGCNRISPENLRNFRMTGLIKFVY